MDYGHYTSQTVEQAVGLVNAFGGDGRPDEPTLRRVLEGFDLKDEPLDLEGLAHLAARLRDVFAEPDPGGRVGRLNALLAHYQPSPHIVDHDGQGPHLHYAPQGAPDLRRVGASLVTALATVLCDHGSSRLGVCAAPRCTDVFVDTTRNGRQRFCSRVCATRVHVAEHRARQRRSA